EALPARRRLIGSEFAARTASARQPGKKLHALDHAPDHRHVTVELARRLADDDIELAAPARVGRSLASGAERAVAMRQRELAVAFADRPAVDEAAACRPGVANFRDADHGFWQPRLIFWRQSRWQPGGRRRLDRGAAPLR